MITNSYIEELIRETVANSHMNQMRYPLKGEKIWSEPLVGFCRGDDEYFDFLVEHIGEEYITPAKAFSYAFGEHVEPSELSVVSYVLPHSDRTYEDQSAVTDRIPSERWCHSRAEGEDFNDFMRDYIPKVLMMQHDIEAIAPMRLDQFDVYKHPQHYRTSNWSERHTAYACGLGTFGLSRGLITKKGIAVRFGSVVIKAKLTPSIREYTHYMEWCVRTQGIDCRDCIDRCPANAITEDGMNKRKCRHFQNDVIAPEINERYDLDGGCGLCQANVVCGNRKP